MTSPPDKAAPAGETAAAIFDRINRRREEVVRPVAGSVLQAEGPSGLADARPHLSVGDSLFDASTAGTRAADDRFPRSATMRLVLKHPAVALGLGLPAAGLLLKSPASRRLLSMALRVGVGGEIRKRVRLTNAAGPLPATDPSAAEPPPLRK